MHVLNACMNCNFNCAVVGVVVVYVYGLVVYIYIQCKLQFTMVM